MIDLEVGDVLAGFESCRDQTPVNAISKHVDELILRCFEHVEAKSERVRILLETLEDSRATFFACLGSTGQEVIEESQEASLDTLEAD